MKSAKHLFYPVIEQAAALCCRVNDEGALEILLISSSDTGRWVLPKGFVDRKETTFKAAQREALEKAGMVGKVRKKDVGHYAYVKDGENRMTVAVHLLKFDRDTGNFRERLQRRRIWFTPSQASTLVDEPDLQEMLGSLNTLNLLASQDKSILKNIAKNSDAPRARVQMPTVT
jgi:8-oxo-dGTP pyrophosphatase MutT (NUDIX family)